MSNQDEEKLLMGCTPQNVYEKQMYELLAQIFAPVVYFDPYERFFPVDLPSTVANSELYRFHGKVTEQLVKNYGNINTVDLALAKRDSFMTVVGWISETKETTDSKSEMPVPKIDEIYNKYSTGAIPAKLTTYATVCRLLDIPNYHFLEQFPPQYDKINLEEGLLINYYFYFPAMESPAVKMEGDWSGISILFRKPPQMDKLISGDMNGNGPLLTCYFKTIGEYNEYMWAGHDGFRMWNKVTTKKDQKTGLNTHPVIYISQGLHNCYYEPMDITIPFECPWKLLPHPSKIERGNLSPSPSTGTTTGVNEYKIPVWLYALFDGLMFLVEACGSLGCVPFDPSGIPIDIGQDINDSVKFGGYESDPESVQLNIPANDDNYPSKPPVPGHPLNLKLNVVYVDLDDQATVGNWAYKGLWGAARVTSYTYLKSDGTSYTSRWGRFGGFTRPNLGPWFLWNLYWDPVFGSSGGGYGGGYKASGP